MAQGWTGFELSHALWEHPKPEIWLSLAHPSVSAQGGRLELRTSVRNLNSTRWYASGRAKQLLLFVFYLEKEPKDSDEESIVGTDSGISGLVINPLRSIDKLILTHVALISENEAVNQGTWNSYLRKRVLGDSLIRNPTVPLQPHVIILVLIIKNDTVQPCIYSFVRFVQYRISTISINNPPPH